MKNLLFILFLLLSVNVFGQQIPYSSQIQETRAFWNPAATAPAQYMETSAFIRQQWVGFSGAPRTVFLSFARPFIDQNMSVGGFLMSDQTGPVGKHGAKLNYAYKLKGLTRDGILSFGISGSVEQYSFNGTDQIFIDGGDGLLSQSRSSSIFPTISGGVYFDTQPDLEEEDNAFYAGLAYIHAFSTNILINEQNLGRRSHIHFLLGTRLFNYDSYWEPTLSVNFVDPEIIDFMLNVKYERPDAFWAGLGYSSVNELSIQGGLIVDDFLGNRYAKLRAGALANYGIQEYGSDFGPGFELVVTYQYDID